MEKGEDENLQLYLITFHKVKVMRYEELVVFTTCHRVTSC